jgi:hypothetical protein
VKGYRTRKISLPGGRVIEIVYFSEDADDSADAAADIVKRALEDAEDAEVVAGGAGSPPPLHVCPSCASDLVYPVAWEESSGSTWEVERRCPNCEWRHIGEFGDEQLASFDEALNDGTEILLIGLRDATRANMEASVERLIDAIKLDLIEPMDF